MTYDNNPRARTAESMVSTLRHDMGCAVNELRRHDFPGELQQSVDSVIRMLTRS